MLYILRRGSGREENKTILLCKATENKEHNDMMT